MIWLNCMPWFSHCQYHWSACFWAHLGIQMSQLYFFLGFVGLACSGMELQTMENGKKPFFWGSPLHLIAWPHLFCDFWQSPYHYCSAIWTCHSIWKALSCAIWMLGLPSTVWVASWTSGWQLSKCKVVSNKKARDANCPVAGPDEKL